jgi:DNA-directed RNA polymerase specialized sigma24 family protein
MILRLRVVEGVSYRRIGELLGMPVGTVGTLLLRARRALAESLRRGTLS